MKLKNKSCDKFKVLTDKGLKHRFLGKINKYRKYVCKIKDHITFIYAFLHFWQGSHFTPQVCFELFYMKLYNGKHSDSEAFWVIVQRLVTKAPPTPPPPHGDRLLRRRHNIGLMSLFSWSLSEIRQELSIMRTLQPYNNKTNAEEQN